MFQLIENYHNDTFYNIFLKNVNESDYDCSGASEYEIYFNFIQYKYLNNIKIRQLKWINSNNFNSLDYDYISFHWYMQ